MPVKRVIALYYANSALTYAMRADVPVGQEKAYEQPGYVSIYKDALDPDFSAIVNGTVAEVVETNSFIRNTPGETVPQFAARVQNALEGRWAVWNADIQGKAPRQFFGRFWNGTVWSNFP